MRKLSNTEIKQTIFDILCSFSEYCDAHGLQYFLSGGTLLGAIRHKGFIPWDDDVDVLMPRKDFDAFHEDVKKEPITDYYKVIGLNAGNSFTPFAKVVDTRTIVDEKYISSDKQLWIDIFPMDGLPEDEEESKKILEKARKLKMNLTRTQAKIGQGKSLIRTIVKIPAMIVLKMIGPESLGKKLDKMARSYGFDESDFIAGISWSLGAKERMEKAKYLPLEDVEFNGRKFHAPAGWDYYLTNIYGDYMTLPPKEKRESHDFVAYIED